MPDECDAVVLDSRPDFFAILGQVKLHPNSKVTFFLARQICVNHKRVLVLNLSVLNLANVHDAGCVDVVRKHHVSPAFRLAANGLTSQRVDLEDRGITGLPNAGCAIHLILVHNSELHRASNVQVHWGKRPHHTRHAHLESVEDVGMIFQVNVNVAVARPLTHQS